MAKLILTQSFINSLALVEGQASADYYDERVPGLLIKILATGRKTYYIRFENKKSAAIQRKIGNAAILKLAEARTLARRYLAALNSGGDAFSELADDSVPKLAHFAANDYIPYVKIYKKSWDMDVSRIKNHILPRLGNLRMHEIQKKNVVELINTLLLTHKPGSVNRIVILLRYMYNLAIKWEITGVEKKPTAGIPLLKENNQAERFLSAVEAMALLRSIKHSRNPMLQHIIPMLILTGARKREVLDAKWEDIDWDRSLWTVPTTKAGKARVVPLSESAVTLLHTLRKRKRSPYIFANPNTLKPYKSFYYSWHTARLNAGLGDVRVHDLRHSFASFLVNAGRSLYEVQTLLGHTQIATTQRYAHLSSDSLRSASNEIANAVPELQ